VEEGELPIDHVLLAVNDLERASDVLNDRYGLTSVEGGRHPQWGTANRIIPVADMYLELVAVVDRDRARDSPFGRWVASGSTGVISPLGWAVRTNAIDDVARRLHLDVEHGSRTAPDGRVLEWNLAGVEHAAVDPALPFFIEWGSRESHPSQMPVMHSAGAVAFARIELRGDRARLDEWLGDHALPVTITHGPPEVSRIVLAADGRDILLGPISS
jgi:hypothetical protein